MLELLLVTAIGAILALCTTGVYVAQLRMNSRLESSRQTNEVRLRFEDRIRNLIESAYLSTSTTDRLTYLLGSSGQPSVIPSTGTDGGNNANPNQGNSGADTLTFTALGTRLKGAVLNATDSDFETLNSQFGPQGGVVEVQISTQPYDAPNGQQGVFLRTQTPSDGDPTQGGFQELLSDQVTQLQWEFFDGTTWQTIWDTTQSTNHRLPTAIRLTYQLNGDSTQRQLVVRLPLTTIKPGQQSTGSN